MIAIRFGGRDLKLKSGKYQWKTVGAAKNALLYHFEHEYNKYAYDFNPIINPAKIGCEVAKRKKEFKEHLYNLVEFVEVYS